MSITILRQRKYRAAKPPTRQRCLCLCDCGRKFFTWLTCIQSGNTSSCGCKRNTRRGDRAKKYAEPYSSRSHPEHRLYARWVAMWARCTDPKNKSYPRYGGRGIYVCKEWWDFETFLKDTGRPPFLGASIDRVDNDGPYGPNNWRWATAKEQSANRRIVKKQKPVKQRKPLPPGFMDGLL